MVHPTVFFRYAIRTVIAATLGAVVGVGSVTAQGFSARDSLTLTHAELRVRVTLPDAQIEGAPPGRPVVLRGSVVAIRGDTIDLRIGAGRALTSVSSRSVNDLSVSRGFVRGWRAHPVRFALSAAAFGAALALIPRTNHGLAPVSGSATILNIMTPTLMGIQTVFIGTTRVEKWERVPH